MENEEKNYRVRVEISLIIEMYGIPAVHEDNAYEQAEDIAEDIASRFVLEAEEFKGCYVKNLGVRCVDSELDEEAN